MDSQAVHKGRALAPGQGDFRAMEPARLLVGGRGRGDGAGAAKADGERGAQDGAGKEKALAEAEEILRQARQEAERIVAEAEERVRRRMEEVEVEVREEYRARLEEALKELGEWKQGFEERLSREVVAVAIEVARKVIAGELETRPEVVGQMALEALRAAGVQGKVRLVVSEDDAETLEREKERLRAESGVEVEIVTSGGLRRGDVMVESDSGEVDARIDSQLAAIREQIGWVEGGEEVRDRAA